MSGLWPWLVVAGLGALHGLNPAGGWLPAAIWGWRSHDRRRALWALIPIAVGHVASMALVTVAVATGLAGRLAVPPEGLAVLLIACVAVHRLGRPHHHAPAAHAGLALGSFWMSTAHGAGLMLVPALGPLCLGGAESAQTSMGSGLAAVVVHAGAMLAVTAAMTAGACHVGQRRPHDRRLRPTRLPSRPF